MSFNTAVKIQRGTSGCSCYVQMTRLSLSNRKPRRAVYWRLGSPEMFPETSEAQWEITTVFHWLLSSLDVGVLGTCSYIPWAEGASRDHRSHGPCC